MYLYKINRTNVINDFKRNIDIVQTKLKSSSRTNENSVDLTLNFESVFEIQNVNSSSSRSIFIEGKLNNNDIALFKVMNKDGDTTNDFFISETQKENEDLYIINYYNSNLEKINTVTIIPSERKILTGKPSGVLMSNTQSKAKNTGQDVMNCISDAYSNHGWVSVWAWVQTAFVPATAVAVAGACVGLNV